MAVLPRKQQL